MVKMRYHYPPVETSMRDKTYTYLLTDMISGYDRWCLNFCCQHFNHVILNNWKISQFWLEDDDEEITVKSLKKYISEICVSFAE